MTDKYLGDNLIFIISQPRCGSTLLQRILCGHPDIESSAETWLMLLPSYADRKDGLQAGYGHNWSLVARDDFLEHYTDGPEVYDEAVRAWAKVFYDNALQKTGGKIFIDKTPRYALIVPELQRFFPQAKFIFLLRNPVASFTSLMLSFVQKNQQIVPEFAPDLFEAPQKIMDGIESLGDAAIVVRYEDLVANPDTQVRKLCEQLDIEFAPHMLDYSQTPEAKGFMTDRVGVQQRSRPTADSLDKWKDALSDPQQAEWSLGYLEDMGPELVGRMGYDYEELRRELLVAQQPAPELMPWRLAKVGIEHYSLRDGYWYSRWQCRKNYGAVRGEFAALYDLLYETCSRLKKSFSRR